MRRVACIALPEVRLEVAANADGTDPVQLTYLDAASFAPFWHPSQKRILFSSNYGDPKGREFDIWAINVDGSGLERITHAPGFDGFPMFSPNGEWLAFSSNRATAEGASDTNVFIARWVKAPAPVDPKSPAQRIKTDASWLADPTHWCSVPLWRPSDSTSRCPPRPASAVRQRASAARGSALPRRRPVTGSRTRRRDGRNSR